MAIEAEMILEMNTERISHLTLAMNIVALILLIIAVIGRHSVNDRTKSGSPATQGLQSILSK